MTVFMDRSRYAVIQDIVCRDLAPADKTCRILSLDDEYRNEELCDVALDANRAASQIAVDIVALCKNA